ncbi:hypothetical protein ACSSS7_004006 [Eimeria intestinalis]
MADTSGGEAPGSPSSSLTWMPPVMFLLAFSLGICCLFFMSWTGMIFCILHCVVGTLVALVTYGTRSKESRLMAFLTVILNALYLLFLVCTFVYAAWLLGRSASAARDFDYATSSPAIRPLIYLYAAAATGDDSALEFRRLQAAGDTVPVDGSHAPTELHFPLSSMNQDSPQHLVNAFARQSGTQPGFSVAEVLHSVESRARGEQPALSPAALRQGPPARFEDLRFSDADSRCLLKLGQDERLAVDTFNRLHAFLDWGLFCGYTQYSAGALKKWPISCSKVCHLDLLNFAQHGDDILRIQEQANEFKRALSSMSEEELQMCGVLTIVTACRMEENRFPAGSMAALCLALLIAFSLFFVNTTCLVIGFKLLGKHKHRGRQVAVAPRS